MRKIVAMDARLVGGASTGDSTYWTGLLHGLRQLRPEYRFLLLSNSARPSQIPEDVQFQWVNCPARNSRWWSWVKAPLLARRLGAEIWHTQYALSPLARGGITTIHDVSFFLGPEWFRASDLFLLKRTVPAAARRAKAVITVSETSRKEIERFIPAARGKTHVTYLACPDWIVPVEREEAQRRVAQKFGLAKPYALTVSTRWPRKNMELAIRAFDHLPADLNLELALTGKAGWGDQEISPRTRALGYVDQGDLGALYSAASLYLCPSRHEGFGLPVLEAFTCGCPVLCSAGGSLPEVAGDAGWVEPSWSAEQWATDISALLGDCSKLIGLRQKGYARAQGFSWEKTARATLDAYRGVLA